MADDERTGPHAMACGPFSICVLVFGTTPPGSKLLGAKNPVNYKEARAVAAISVAVLVVGLVLFVDRAVLA